jgi:hypothetical protein
MLSISCFKNIYILYTFFLIFPSNKYFIKGKSIPAIKDKNQHPFVGFFVFPHGGITLNPTLHDFSEDGIILVILKCKNCVFFKIIFLKFLSGGSREGSREDAIRLHNAMTSAATALMETRPDVIILSTPHGYYLDERFLFVGNPSVCNFPT